ncbi:MAG: hypothetical protein LBH90_02720 [Tannerella sp.]|jgi:hypothetical protein|nr:hypothetical protein [Tannerella sp.]
MKTHDSENELLKKMFRLMPEEKLSSTFQQEIMLRIQTEARRIQRRNTIIQWSVLLLASLLIIGLCIVSFIYLDIPQIHLPSVKIAPLYLFMGIAALILLLADCFFRKVYDRQKTSRTE